MNEGKPWDSLIGEARDFLAAPGFSVSTYEALMRRLFAFMQTLEEIERVRMMLAFLDLTESGRAAHARLSEIVERNGTVTEEEFDAAVMESVAAMNDGERRGFVYGQAMGETIVRTDGRN